MKLSYSIFYTSDIPRIRKYYQDSFGWIPELEFDHFLDYNFGNARLGIKLGNKEREVSGSQTTIFEVENIEKLYEKVQYLKLDIYKELAKQEWGTSFAVLDIDGNKLEFSGSR